MAHTARFDFSGANVLVTGGSNGIGHAIATGFRDAGARVTITGTRADGVYDTDFSGLSYHALDMRDAAGIAALAAALPNLDVLVNCAGQARFNEYKPDVFEETVAVNLTGSFRMANAVLPQLKASRGSVINIASMTSYFGMSLIPGYGASKAGVLQLTKTLAEAWASDGVRVNAIAPGWVETNMTAPAQSNPDFDAKIVAHTPMKRWAKPAEMAGTVLFLCSDAAAFITGVTVPIDGGFSAVM
jgi:3-oxoacyl-[acyl-carrier protein] reductase